ncbi:hypothetical protein ILYODFUR_024382 [Ilyodon furcidens]|uniref:Uncharacterized protein n=1 Tax=Ilyodon furcidens TaxID=33524 RepID=A0ABV0VJR6_9TELE
MYFLPVQPDCSIFSPCDHKTMKDHESSFEKLQISVELHGGEFWIRSVIQDLFVRADVAVDSDTSVSFFQFMINLSLGGYVFADYHKFPNIPEGHFGSDD